MGSGGTKQPNSKKKLPIELGEEHQEAKSTNKVELPTLREQLERIRELESQEQAEHVQNHLLKFFKYDHLPDHLQLTNKVFANVAVFIDEELPKCAESTAALRKLLEAKDCAVRAKLEG